MRLAIGVDAKGNVRSSTLHAFGEPEMARIVQGLA